MEHTGVSARQRAGTLERVVKYDQEAFTKAWDYLAKSPSDDEADQKKYFFSIFFFFRHFFTPGKRPKYGHLGADRLFFGRSHMLGGA